MAHDDTGPTGAPAVQDELLLQAVAVLQRRYEDGGRVADLSPEDAAELRNTLEGIASGRSPEDEAHRDEAVALAHRLLDDDNPELSPLWPSGTS